MSRLGRSVWTGRYCSAGRWGRPTSAHSAARRVPGLGGADGGADHRVVETVPPAGPGLGFGVAIGARDRVVHALADVAETAVAGRDGDGLEQFFVAPFDGVGPGVDQPGDAGIVVLLVQEHEGQESDDVLEEPRLARRVILDVLDLDLDGIVHDRQDRLAQAADHIRIVLRAGRLAVADLLQLFEVAKVPVGDPPVEFRFPDVERHDGVEGHRENSLWIFLDVGLAEDRAVGNAPDVPFVEAQGAAQGLYVAGVLDGVVGRDVHAGGARVAGAVGDPGQRSFRPSAKVSTSSVAGLRLK